LGKNNAKAENSMKNNQNLKMILLAIVFACICGNIPYGKILPSQFCKLEAQWGVCKNTPLNTNGSDAKGFPHQICKFPFVEYLLNSH
jgi:hypothetical protein